MSHRTKQALEASLKRLLLQKPLSKITVSELAEESGINRMTFYYHFKDIYDLVEWCCAEDVRPILEGKLTYDSWQDAFLDIFRLLRENKPLIMNILRGVESDQLMRYLGPIVHKMVWTMVEQLSASMPVSDEDKQFIAGFYEYAFIGVTLNWVHRDMKEDPAAIVERTSILIRGNVSRALEAFRQDRSSHFS